MTAINILAIIVIIIFAFMKVEEVASDKQYWKNKYDEESKITIRQSKDIAELTRIKSEVNQKFKRFKREYERVYDFSIKYQEQFKKEQIQAINKELEQLQGKVLTVEQVNRKNMLTNARSYLENL